MPAPSRTAPTTSIDWSAEPDLEELRSLRRVVKTDPSDAVGRLHALADRGSLVSMYLLGACYGSGRGVGKDPVEAERWLRRAGQGGSIEGSYRLGGMLHRQGRHQEAFNEYERLAAVGFTPAMNRLGSMHFRGEGVVRDVGRAKALWEQASSLGHLYARRNLGRLLMSGRFGLRAVPRGAALVLSAAMNAARVADPDRPNDLLR